jgi:hypothetical protein
MQGEGGVNIERVNLDMEQERWFAEYTKAPTVIIMAFCTTPAPGSWRIVSALTDEEYLKISDTCDYVHRFHRSAIAARVYHLRGGDNAANVN